MINVDDQHETLALTMKGKGFSVQDFSYVKAITRAKIRMDAINKMIPNGFTPEPTKWTAIEKTITKTNSDAQPSALAGAMPTPRALGLNQGFLESIL